MGRLICGSVSMLVNEAARGNVKEVIRQLKLGQNVNGHDEDMGDTALHVACEFGHLKVVQILLKYGATINVKNTKSLDTPLHRAASTGRITITEMLLNRGADKYAAAKTGRLAIDAAIEYSKDGAVMLLGDTPESAVCRFVHCDAKGMRLEVHSETHAYLRPNLYECRYLLLEQASEETEWNQVFGEIEGEYEQLAEVEEEKWKIEEMEVDATPMVDLNVWHEMELKELLPASVYMVKSRSRNAIGYSEFGRYKVVRTHMYAPEVIQRVWCPRVSRHNVKLEWEPPVSNGTKVTNYNLRYCVLPDGGDRPLEKQLDGQVLPWIVVNLEVTRSFATIDDLAAGTVYAFQVQAINNLGNSDWSDHVTTGAIYETAVDTGDDEDANALIPKMISKMYATKVEHDQIQLRWVTPSFSKYPPLEFELQMWCDHCTTSNTIKSTNVSCCTMDGLTPGTQYYCAVRARNINAWGEYTIPPSVFCTKDKPQVLHSYAIKCMETTSDSIALSWSNGEPATQNAQFELRVFCNVEDATNKYYTELPDDTIDIEPKLPCVGTNLHRDEYLVTNVMANTKYRFSVRAKVNGIWEPFSKIKDCASICTKASEPNTPSKLSVVKELTSDACIQWEQPRSNGFPIVEYELSLIAVRDYSKLPESNTHPTLMGYCILSSNLFTNKQDLAEFQSCHISPVWYGYSISRSYWNTVQLKSDTLEYTFKDLRPNTEYYGKIRAKNEVGWSKPTSFDAMVNIRTKRATPEAPYGFSDRRTFKQQLLMRWDPPADNGYAIETYEVNISPDDQEQVIDGQTCTCTFRALRPGIYYSLGLRAKNQLGWGSIANVIVRTDCDIPEKPENVVISEHEHQGILVTWDMPEFHGSPISRYHVECRTKDEDWGCASDTIVEPQVVFTKYGDIPLYSGVLYMVRVRCCNEVGWGAFSDGNDKRSRLILNASAPYAPGIPNVVDLQHNSATLTWSIPSQNGGADVSVYELQQKIVDESDEWRTLSDNIKSTLYIVFDLVFKKHIFRVRAKNEFGWGLYSESSKVTRPRRRF